MHVSGHYRYTDIHYILLSVIFKLKYVRTLLNWLWFRECPKVCKTGKCLLFAIETPNAAISCPRQCPIENKFKKYVINWGLVIIATWFIQGFPYPQSIRSRFSHLTFFGYIKPRTSFSVLLWVYACMFLCITYILACNRNFWVWCISQNIA